MSITKLELAFVGAIDEIGAEAWNSAAGFDYPFTRYEFLHALEESGAVAEDKGWQPHHLIIRRNTQLVGVMPFYLKTHSYGEYVFVICQDMCSYNF
jgi:predicted N-acyltransferase